MQAELEAEYVEYVTARLAALRRFAFLLCGDEHRADDLVQQAITRLYQRWRRARTATNVDRYVRTILLRAFLDEKRQAWSLRVALTGAPPERSAPEGPDLAQRERELPDAPIHTFVWLPDGTRQRLPWPEVDAGTVVGFAAGTIGHDGVIIGLVSHESGDGGRSALGYRYDRRTGEFTRLAEGHRSRRRCGTRTDGWRATPSSRWCWLPGLARSSCRFPSFP